LAAACSALQRLERKSFAQSCDIPFVILEGFQMSDLNPLSSWVDGPNKSAILDFVARVTNEDDPHFRPVAERIATFDNDGTLWCEFPNLVQVLFTLDEVKRLTSQRPELLDKPAYKAFVAGDLKTLASLPRQDVFETVFAIHGGMSVDDFEVTVAKWISSARHPTLGRLVLNNTYQPQQELLAYLRANEFKTFIVTGGGIEFVRVVSQSLYGIPVEQVIGSSTKCRLDTIDGNLVLRKLPDLGSFDDRDEKVVNIGLHLGRRPIFAFGNSDGDLSMLRYTLQGEGARLGLLLHHDDAAREFAYDRDFSISPLNDALENADAYGIRVVSMKSDWRSVFSFASA
jgi:phosphoserine phosphatase